MCVRTLLSGALNTTVSHMKSSQNPPCANEDKNHLSVASFSAIKANLMGKINQIPWGFFSSSKIQKNIFSFYLLSCLQSRLCFHTRQGESLPRKKATKTIMKEIRIDFL